LNLRTANRRRRARRRRRPSPHDIPYVRYIQRLYGRTLAEGEASVGLRLRAIVADGVEIATEPGEDRTRLNVSLRDGRIVDVWDFG
jgi:hypothetical protein